MNRELTDVQAGFRKGRGTRDQIANICWIIGKTRKFQKNIYFCFIDNVKTFDCVNYNKPYNILGEGNGTPLQYSCLENPMDGGAWWAAVHGVAKSQTQLSNFTFTFHFHALEKDMATHSSVPAWRIPGTGAPGGLLSMGSHRGRHD